MDNKIGGAPPPAPAPVTTDVDNAIKSAPVKKAPAPIPAPVKIEKEEESYLGGKIREHTGKFIVGIIMICIGLPIVWMNEHR